MNTGGHQNQLSPQHYEPGLWLTIEQLMASILGQTGLIIPDFVYFLSYF